MRRISLFRFSLFSICLLLFLNLFSNNVYANDNLSFTNDDYVFNTPILTLDDYLSSDMLESGSAYDNGNKVWNWYNFDSTITLHSGYYMFLTQAKLKVDVQSGTYDITVKVKFSTGTGFSQGSGFFSAWTSADEKIVGGHVAAKCTYKDGYAYYTFKDVNLSKDVNLIRVEFDMFLNNTTELTTNPVLWTFDKQDTTEGLLSGIIEFIKGIYNGIIDLPNKIADSISGFFTWIVNAIDTMKNAITNALTSLGNFLIDGIKGLFVPTDAQLQEYADKWDILIKNRFGALYDCFTIVDEFASGLKYTGNKSVIEFPSVTVDLAGVPFTYGGWSVQVIPTGFEFLIDSIKFVTNIACTLLFINSIKNRFERIIGGQE